MNRFGRLNTLRNQIFLGFMLVMIIVLALVGVLYMTRFPPFCATVPRSIFSRRPCRPRASWMRCLSRWIR